jgi:hypothetical protein
LRLRWTPTQRGHTQTLIYTYTTQPFAIMFSICVFFAFPANCALLPCNPWYAHKNLCVRRFVDIQAMALESCSTCSIHCGLIQPPPHSLGLEVLFWKRRLPKSGELRCQVDRDRSHSDEFSANGMIKTGQSIDQRSFSMRYYWRSRIWPVQLKHRLRLVPKERRYCLQALFSICKLQWSVREGHDRKAGCPYIGEATTNHPFSWVVGENSCSSVRNWSLSWANVWKWLPCAEMAATMSKAPRRFTARNYLAETFCSGEVIERLKANLRRLIQWKSVVGGKSTHMKPFQPRGSHFEMFAQLRDQFLTDCSGWSGWIPACMKRIMDAEA